MRLFVTYPVRPARVRSGYSKTRYFRKTFENFAGFASGARVLRNTKIWYHRARYSAILGITHEWNFRNLRNLDFGYFGYVGRVVGLNLRNGDLVRRASRGEVGAFSQLIREHSDLVYRVALRMLGDGEAQDASQEVWIRVWRSINGFRGESAFSTWLYRITVNTCLNAREKELRRETRELREELPFLPEPSGGEYDPEATTLSRERKGELADALQHLRDEHRAALVLRHMEGLGYAEISEILEVPEGTAKGWVSRARASLLVLLSGDSGNGQDAHGRDGHRR